MAPIRYSLHYEDYSEHLMSRFGKLLQMQSFVDMTLMCSSHTLRVHKAVLAASSAYFQEVLQKQTGEPLIILKMRFSVLKSLVEFMYCGKTQCLEENLDELVSAAQFLKIKGLSKVTKEGLGITNQSELPVFTPPVVINRPPQSLIDLHNQENADVNLPPPPSQLPSASSISHPPENLGKPNKDMVVRIPFDVEGGGAPPASDYDHPRAMKPRRGRPTRPGGVGGGNAWEGTGLGRAAERALLRREQDSRKAIHHLKHLQTRQMQEYMDRVTLSQAVSSICGPETSTDSSYMNMDNDFMYMDQTVATNVLDPSITYSKDHTLANETITSSYTTPSYTSTGTSSSNYNSNGGISTAMSQYVNALKNAGLPTDLPILFESGDGSYINVNEQVLLDMVHSSEIQYEVIEQPNLIENVANPNEIKSIDELSESIERGEMMMNTTSYNDNFEKDTSQYIRHEDAINSLNSILPDSLETFGDQHNYVVLDPSVQQGNNTIGHDHANDFSCIDGDMQFFTKSMSDDVKKFYEGQQLDDAREMDQLCPTSTSMDTNFTMSMLGAKSLESENMSQQYNPLNTDDLRRNDDCYDFGLQLTHTSDYKEDALECLMASSNENEKDKIYEDSEKAAKERAEIIKDLMNVESKINGSHNVENENVTATDRDEATENNHVTELATDTSDEVNNTSAPILEERTPEITSPINSSGLREAPEISDKNDMPECTNNIAESDNSQEKENPIDVLRSHSEDAEVQYKDTVIDLTAPVNIKSEQWNDFDEVSNNDKENVPVIDKNDTASTNEDIPYAVGLLPLKQVQVTNEKSLLKRRSSCDADNVSEIDAKCLKRKSKFKKL